MVLGVLLGTLSVFTMLVVISSAIVAGRYDRAEEELLRRIYARERMKKMQKNEEKTLWRFDGNICDHGICVGDCDKCNRNLPFQEEEDDGTD